MTPELPLCVRLAPRRALAVSNEKEAEECPGFYRPQILVWRDRHQMSERMTHTVYLLLLIAMETARKTKQRGMRNPRCGVTAMLSQSVRRPAW